MAARMFAPKVASLMGSTSSKVARPVVRSAFKTNTGSSQRAFSGMSLQPVLVPSTRELDQASIELLQAC